MTVNVIHKTECKPSVKKLISNLFVEVIRGYNIINCVCTKYRDKDFKYNNIDIDTGCADCCTLHFKPALYS